MKEVGGEAQVRFWIIILILTYIFFNLKGLREEIKNGRR